MQQQQAVLPGQGVTAATELPPANGALARSRADSSANMLGQQCVGLGAMKASNAVLAGSASRPAGMPMA